MLQTCLINYIFQFINICENKSDTTKHIRCAKATIHVKRIVFLGLGTLGTQSLLLWKEYANPIELVLVDRDIVSAENIDRQTLYHDDDIGLPKPIAAQQRLQTKHKTSIIAEDITAQNVHLLQGSIIIDGTDNLLTRHVASAYAHNNDIPFVYGGAVARQGAAALFCKQTCWFQDIFRKKIDNEDCATVGIDIDVAKQVAQWQYTIGHDALTGTYSNTMFMTEGNLQLPNKGALPSLHTTADKNIMKLCGRDLYQAWVDEALAKKIVGNSAFIEGKTYTMFKNGRVLVRAKSIDEAKQHIVKITE